jgi:PilZ domain
MADKGHDKRGMHRLDMPGDLHGEVMVFMPMTIREISRSGMQVDTTVSLHINSLHELRLSLGSRSIVVRGRVVHCSISDVDQEQVIYRAGIEFIDPPEHVGGVIASFVDEVSAARNEPRAADGGS